MEPVLIRELIRLANRDGLNSTEVSSVLEFGEYLSKMGSPSDPDVTVVAEALLDVWKESFDQEP